MVHYDIYGPLYDRIIDLTLLTPIFHVGTWRSKRLSNFPKSLRWLRGMVRTWLQTPRPILPFYHTTLTELGCKDILGIRRVESGAYASARPTLTETAVSPSHQRDEDSCSEYLGEERRLLRDWVIYIASWHLWLLKRVVGHLTWTELFYLSQRVWLWLSGPNFGWLAWSDFIDNNVHT